MTQPSVAVSAAFLAIVASLVAVLAVFLRHAELAQGADPARARGRALVAVLAAGAWLVVTAVLAVTGVIRDFDAVPPRLTLLVGPPLVGSVVLAMTPLGRRLALGIPVALLVGFQSFRVAMELVLHRLFLEGVVPVQMTYDGRNFDVLTGLAALPVAALAAKGRLPRWGELAFHLGGLALLANIVVIAILSMPYPFRRFLEGPANEVVFWWPFVWPPAFVVPAAFLGHLLGLRRLATSSR